MNPLIILVAVVGFVTLGGLGFVFAGAGSGDARVSAGPRRSPAPAARRRRPPAAKLAQQDAGNRRKQTAADSEGAGPPADARLRCR